MTTYVYDRVKEEMVLKGTETALRSGPGAIVRKYEHVARCLPMRAERDRQGRVTKGIAGHRGGYDKGGRAVITSKQGIQDIIAANPHVQLNWNSE